MQQATGIANTPYQSYTGQRYADLNQTQNLGIGMTQDRALNGDQTINTGANYLQNQLQSGPMAATSNPYAQQQNPYLDSMVDLAQQSVARNWNTTTKPQIEASMVQSGAFGNSGLNEYMANSQKAAAQQMSDIATQMYGNAYNTQAQLGESAASRQDAANQNWRSNNLNAAQLGLSYGNQAYTDAGQLLNAGNLQQQQQQQNLDFGYQQFQNAQDYPYKQLAATGGVVGQNIGQTTTSKGGSGK